MATRTNKYTNISRLCFMIITIAMIACNQKKPAIANNVEKGSPLPAIQLLLTDSSSSINTANASGGRPTILLYFSPGCHFCQAQIEDITNNMKDLKNISFYILTSASYTDMMWFYKHYQLNKYSNVTVGVDYEQAFTKYFKNPGVPYIAVFGKNKQLNETFLGKTSINKIMKVAEL